MRLVRLSLTRYGKFTDYPIDFGPKLPGKPDFHVIYGDNEAGKTTTLTAFLDLLFGIEKDTPYNFLHAYDTMEIGGVLEFANGTREFRRIKRQANSLLDASGQPVPEAAILAELDGLGRNEYNLKFSLDADTLKTGGKNILASKGDLGELLFAASAGVANLSQKLNDIRATVDEFYRQGTRKNGLAELKAKIKALDDRKKEIDTLASKYATFIAERKKASEAYDTALNARTEASNKKAKIASIESAMPRFDALKRIAGQLAPLADVSEVPPDMKERVAQLQKAEFSLDTNLGATLDNIEQWTAQLGDIAVDDTALALAGRLDDDDLAESRARYVTARDITKIQTQVSDISADIAAILREIGRKAEETPEDLLLNASVTVALRELIESWAGVDAKLNAARKEFKAAQDKYAEAQDTLDKAQTKSGVADQDALKILGPVVADIRSRAYDAAATQANRTAQRLRAALAEAMKPLAPWRGGADALASLRLPEAEQVARWKHALETAEKSIKDLDDKIQDFTTGLSDLEAQKDAVAATVGVVSDAEAAQTRLDRDEAWAKHRRALTAETADAFHSQLQADDLVTTARLVHVSEVARVNSLLTQIAVKTSAIERHKELHARALNKLDEIRGEIAAAITAVSSDFVPTLSPSEFSTWATSYQNAVKAYDACGEGERVLAAAEEDRAAAVQRLGHAMAKCGIAHAPADGLETMMVLAEAARDASAHLQALAAAADDGARELRKRQVALEGAEKSLEEWSSRWKAVCAACWIGETDPEPTIRLVGEILAKLAKLAPLLKERGGLNTRIDSMRRDQAHFAKAIETIAAEMAEAADGRSPIALADHLAARVKAAQAARVIRSTQQKAIDDERKKENGYREKLAQHMEEKRKLFAILGVDSLDEAALKVQRANDKAGLQQQKDEEERLILSGLGLDTMAQAEAMRAELDPAQFEGEKVKAGDDFATADKKLQEAHAKKLWAEDQISAVGGDDAVARIDEERQTVLLEIEEKARQWLRLHAGLLAADQALRAYREKHRSTMLTNASDAFKTISRGTYAKLTTRPEGAGEKLVGLTPAGGSKDSDKAMSKGTQFQLYLALRIAGYQEYANARQPPSGVPFIADDIMETFDNHRAHEAFGIFAKLAEIGQIIYLTHHEHLCAIAQKVCPDVRLHRLS